MRIGIDGRYAEGNLAGIGKYIKYLSTGLAGRGEGVVIFYSQKPKVKIREKNISSVILPYKNRYFFEQVALPKAFQVEKIDLYHAAGNIGIPWRCPIPSVLTVHDIIPLTTKSYFKYSKWPFLSRTSYGLRTITSCWKADKIITITNFVKQELVAKLKMKPPPARRLGVSSCVAALLRLRRSGGSSPSSETGGIRLAAVAIKQEKITVVNSGVEIVHGRKKLPEKITEGKYILNHGGIARRKNLERLIRVFSKIHKEFPQLKLVITGENSNLKPELEELVNNLNLRRFVIFPGYVDEETLWSLIRNASCICLPSLSEGFGATVLEGFAAGVPVVCSNTTSLPEIAGDAALLADPNDEEAISAGIRKVLTDRGFAEKLVKKGLARAKNYTWKKTVTETVKVYKEAVEKHL